MNKQEVFDIIVAGFWGSTQESVPTVSKHLMDEFIVDLVQVQVAWEMDSNPKTSDWEPALKRIAEKHNLEYRIPVANN